MSLDPSPLRPEIFILQTGGLGDVVLTAPLVDALKRGGERVVLCVGRPLQGLPALFPTPPDESFAFDVNPYASFKSASDLYHALQPLVAGLASHRVTTFIGAAYRPNWFSLFLAAVLRPEKIVISPVAGGLDEPTLHAALSKFDLPQPAFSARQFAEDLAEPERYRLLSEYVTGSPALDLDWPVSAHARSAALEWLREANMPGGQHIVCFPFGSPSVPLKIWPIERFIGALNQAAEASGLGESWRDPGWRRMRCMPPGQEFERR